MSEINHDALHGESMSDAVLYKHLTWVGVVVAGIAVAIASVANTIG